MIGKSRRSVVVRVNALGTALGLTLILTASAQEKGESQESLQADRYPTYIRVYSKDGKGSLTGTCKAKYPATGQLTTRPRDPGSVDEITCTLISVHYVTPDQRSKKTPMPSTYEEFINQAVKADLKFAEELKRNPKKVREDWDKRLDELCSAERTAGLKKRMQEIQMGPKMKERYQTMIDACQSKDFKTLIDEMITENSRTCSIWVQTFTLDLKRIGKEKWLSNPGPQGLCNVVEVYELEVFRGGSTARTVRHTMLAVGGAKSGVTEFLKGICEAIREDLKEPMVWSATNNDVFEPICDFIKHDYILAPLP